MVSSYDLSFTQSEALCKNLRCKAIFFDINVLIDPLIDLKSDNIQPESQKNNISRGDSVKNEETSKFTEIKGLHDVTAKYMSKLKNKVGFFSNDRFFFTFL